MWVRVGGNGGNPKKAESHLRRSESTQGAPGVQGGLFGVKEGAVGSQEVAGKWRCMNDFSQKVEDFSRFFEVGSFRPWRRRRWSRLAERSPKPVFPIKTDKGKWVSNKTRKIRRFSRRTCRPGYWPVIRLGRPQRPNPGHLRDCWGCLGRFLGRLGHRTTAILSTRGVGKSLEFRPGAPGDFFQVDRNARE